MTTKDRICNRYFDWLYDLVCEKRFAKGISYRKLLMQLHSIEFIYSIPNDGNRAADGEDLRYRFTLFHDCRDMLDYLDGPCSVLEMMIALAIRCEENIMDDPSVGDRTGQWFWNMVVSLGLGSMTDSRYDKSYVEDAIWRFMDREYEPDGQGGLFTVRHCNCDMRDLEIWNQLSWYIRSIV